MASTPPLIHEDFLLSTPLAQRLYHEVAEPLPIIDYHCHLPPEEVAENHRFRSITGIWLDGDHYKWRAMRTNGEPERLCTGDGSDWEKFQAWARTVPAALRNPLYHWTHLELAFPFGIRDRLLNPETARGIYDECNEKLSQPQFSAQGLLSQFKVEVVCTTDDPVDSLAAHQKHARSGGKTKLLPTWRPDLSMAVGTGEAYTDWLQRLEQASGQSVSTYSELLSALEVRHAFFHELGCRLSDRGVDRVPRSALTAEQAASVFAKARAGQAVSEEEQEGFRGRMLRDLGRMDHARGWTMQLHIGALRSVNTRLVSAIGPNTGFDSMDDAPVAGPLAALLNDLDRSDELPRTILYNLNPASNEVMATMIGNFQDGTSAGKLQYGSAWWFLDQLDGMEKQINALSNMGLLSRFVGMLTDSRSFLSYSRHEYFRRLLCNMLGEDVRRGLLPNDEALLGGLVSGVCYHNAREYFSFHV